MRVIYLILIFGICIMSNAQNSFRTEQKKYSRVRDAYTEKEAGLKILLSEKGIEENNFEIFLRAFKLEDTLEVWIKNKNDDRYILFKKYRICSRSGTVGPKRKQGDGQVPEGFYKINVFNPVSNFHLSMGVNYPNGSDRKLSDASSPGGDIYIHGSCVTIGCIPITDDKIKELYILAVEAKSNGQKTIPVHIFPFRLTDDNIDVVQKKYPEKEELISFWENLAPGYKYFEDNRDIPNITIASDGTYQISPDAE